MILGLDFLLYSVIHLLNYKEHQASSTSVHCHDLTSWHMGDVMTYTYTEENISKERQAGEGRKIIIIDNN